MKRVQHPFIKSISSTDHKTTQISNDPTIDPCAPRAQLVDRLRRNGWTRQQAHEEADKRGLD